MHCQLRVLPNDGDTSSSNLLNPNPLIVAEHQSLE